MDERIDKKFAESVALMSDEELLDAEVKWGETNAPDSKTRLGIVRLEIERRRSSYGTTGLLEAGELVYVICGNAGYDETLKTKLYSLFVYAYPRINALLGEILGNDPKFPAGREFKDVWCLDDGDLDNLLKPYTPKPMFSALEIVLSGTTDERNKAKVLSEKLDELARFDFLLGEDLKSRRIELLELAKDEGGKVDLEKKATRFFDDVIMLSAAETKRAERQDAANRTLVKDYFAETLEPHLMRTLTELKEEKKREAGIHPQAERETEVHAGHLNIFRRNGDVFEIRFRGRELVPVRKLAGLFHILLMLRTSQREIPVSAFSDQPETQMENWQAEDQGLRIVSKAETNGRLDDKARNDYESEAKRLGDIVIPKLRENKREFEEHSNNIEAQACEEEIQNKLHRLAQIEYRLNRDKYPEQETNAKRAQNRVRNAINDALSELERDERTKDFAVHFMESYSGGESFCYKPKEQIDWVTI